MRITDAKEIDRLLSKRMLSPDSAKAAKNVLKKNKSSNKSALSFCPFPPGISSKDDPAHLLAHLMIREFGCYFHGGEVVLELECIPLRRYRADIALPRYKVSIEIEGWQYHSKLHSFQRDRTRMLDFFRYGWRVLNVTNKQVKEDSASIIEAVRDVIQLNERPASVNVRRHKLGRSVLIHE